LGESGDGESGDGESADVSADDQLQPDWPEKTRLIA